MSKEKVEIYLQEKIQEYLKTLEVFEKKNLADREQFVSIQQKTQMFKKDNPEGTFKDVKENLIKIQELHYWSFLLEQNMKHELVKVKELIVLSDILGIKLELVNDHQEAVEAIRKQESDMFYVDKSGGVSLLDTEFKPQIEAAINDKKADEENLKTMYSHIPVPESM
tara:strand:+ start:383 stop:883 length:501 start_codon:yes stop_codon:yes gene_type:complete